ncbi:MAG: hypothetical protein IAF94_16585, partial [Pirellulaceae bacterium]|nr:hypothetical protein [Pirellulaceae bacterium]
MANIGPYHTLSELLGTRVVVSDLIQSLSKIPRSDVLRCLAGLSTLVSRETSGFPQEQLRILHHFAPIDIAAKLEKALVTRKLSGPLFFRRQLWFVWQMALIACKDDSTIQHDTQTQRQVGLCCLMASDVMKDVEIAQPVDAAETETLRFIVTTLISHSEAVSDSEGIARCQLFWLELQQDEESKRLLKRIGLQPIAHTFEAAYGIPLEEFIRFATTLYLKFGESTLRDPPSALMFDSSQAFKDYFTHDHIAKSLKLLSTTPDGLASRLLGTPRQSWAF